MTLVLDASLLVALASSEPAGALVEERLAGWIADDEDLHAPALVYYEVATVELAGRLERKSVYDAVYVALAESLGATLVVLDGSLYRNARARGLPVELLSTEVRE